jgi:two-component system nitrate/nitrite response regulator NarL
MGAFNDTSDRAVPTIIIESHRLLRDGLASLISNFSYRIVDSFSSISEVGGLPETSGSRQLVLLGLQKLDAAENAAAHVRKMWPECKIVLLLDHLSPEDYQSLLTSEDIDGCVPLHASRHVLISILDLVVFNDVRIIVMAGTDRHGKAEDASRNGVVTTAPKNGLDTSGRRRIEGTSCRRRAEASTPYLITPAQLSDIVPFQASVPQIVSVAENGYRVGEATDISHQNGHDRSPRNCPRLSTREWQILSGLVKGHANKVIARDCNITEATVKVHMKSILRKIRVDNRTQAAVWALENGSTPQELTERLSSAVAEFSD